MFKIFMKNSVSKLALDECYSEKTQKEFANYEVTTVDDANYSYQFRGRRQLVFVTLNGKLAVKGGGGRQHGR